MHYFVVRAGINNPGCAGAGQGYVAAPHYCGHTPTRNLTHAQDEANDAETNDWNAAPTSKTQTALLLGKLQIFLAGSTRHHSSNPAQRPGTFNHRLQTRPLLLNERTGRKDDMTAPLTDLEITRACARAMGIDETEIERDIDGFTFGWYAPLTDGAQALALVKRFNLDLQAPQPPVWTHWTATCWPERDGMIDRSGRNSHGKGDTANLAICICVAAMTAPKD